MNLFFYHEIPSWSSSFFLPRPWTNIKDKGKINKYWTILWCLYILIWNYSRANYTFMKHDRLTKGILSHSCSLGFSLLEALLDWDPVGILRWCDGKDPAEESLVSTWEIAKLKSKVVSFLAYILKLFVSVSITLHTYLMTNYHRLYDNMTMGAHTT